MNLSEIFDSYALQARLQPALFALFPLFLTTAVLAQPLYDAALALVGLAVACGAVVYVAHTTRTLGRNEENRLYEEWGGKPTTIWLSHKDSNLDPMTKVRYHSFLAQNVPGWRAPDAAEECKDFEKASDMYDSAVRWLRENTRDKSRFGLLLEENISYGFRRNLYALKKIGLLVSMSCFLVNVAAIFSKFTNDTTEYHVMVWVSLVICALVFLSWVYVIKKSWVRDAANGYARALLASCDQLAKEDAKS